MSRVIIISPNGSFVHTTVFILFTFPSFFLLPTNRLSFLVFVCVKIFRLNNRGKNIFSLLSCTESRKIFILLWKSFKLNFFDFSNIFLFQNAPKNAGKLVEMKNSCTALNMDEKSARRDLFRPEPRHRLNQKRENFPLKCFRTHTKTHTYKREEKRFSDFPWAESGVKVARKGCSLNVLVNFFSLPLQFSLDFHFPFRRQTKDEFEFSSELCKLSGRGRKTSYFRKSIEQIKSGKGKKMREFFSNLRWSTNLESLSFRFNCRSSKSV